MIHPKSNRIGGGDVDGAPALPLLPLDVATGILKKVKKVNETHLICCTNDEVIAHYQLTSGRGCGGREAGRKSVRERERERANRYNVALTKVATARS